MDKVLYNKQTSATYLYFICLAKLGKKYQLGVPWTTLADLLLITSNSVMMWETLLIKMSNEEKHRYRCVFIKMVKAKIQFEKTGVNLNQLPAHDHISIYDTTYDIEVDNLTNIS